MEDFLRRAGFTNIARRSHDATSLKKIAESALNQQTLMVLYVPFEPRPQRNNFGTDALVAALRPVPWLFKVLEAMKSELFGGGRFLTMTIVRGSDLAKCLARRDSARDDGSFENLVSLMQQCFQADADIEAVVSTIQQSYGRMGVYLTGDERSDESLNFFQERGYKTRLDSAVSINHLGSSDAMFLDLQLAFNSTIFIGSSKSKISKQIVSIRESIGLPSFVLKAGTNHDASTIEIDHQTGSSDSTEQEPTADAANRRSLLALELASMSIARAGGVARLASN